MQQRLIKQILILSLVLNGVLVALLFYGAAHPMPTFFAFAPLPPPFSEEEVATLQEKSFSDLLSMLSEPATQKIALSALVAFHDFAIDRAATGPLTVQYIGSYPFFPEVTKAEYKHIIDFAQKELYPYTVKGLYKRLPETSPLFCTSTEFVQLELLFKRTHLPIARNHLVAMVQEAPFEILQSYVEMQKKGSDYGEERRRSLLLSYLHAGSKMAGYLLLVTDFAYATKLPAEEVEKLLSLLDIKTEEAIAYSKALLAQDHASSRVKELAARFYPRPAEGALEPPFRERHPKALGSDMHVVKEGESLWIIARKYHVSIEALMQANNLHSTTLRAGKMLKIPQGGS